MENKFAKMTMESGKIQPTKLASHQYNSHSQLEADARQWQHQPFTAPPSLPIDDFYLTENPAKYSEDERQLRTKLAAVYRLIELNGWAMGIYNHVTAKLDKQHEKILIHPFGLHYNEITASSLLKIDMSGNIVDQGTTNFELNRPGYIVHSAIHLARPDLKAVIHLHYPPVSAASACKYGLLPICQEQALLGDIAYLDYSGILTQEDERDAVAAGLGDKRKVMILHNHGLIVCGETIEEAYYLLSNLMRACETQARLVALGGIESLVLMSDEASQQAYEMVQNARYPIKQVIADEDERSDESTTSGNESDMEQADHRIKAQIQAKKGLRKKIVGYVNMFELDFEANMRALDAAGHQTGYKYKRPLVRQYKRAI
jgi:adducin